MKRTLLTPVLLILRALVATGVVLAGVLVIDGAFPAAAEIPPAALAGLLAGLLWTYLRATVQPVTPFLMVSLNGLVIALLFAASAYFQLPHRFTPTDGDTVLPSLRSEADWSETIVYGRTYSLYVSRRQGIELKDVILVRHGTTPRMQVYPEMYLNEADRQLVGTGERPLSTEGLSGTRQRVAPQVFVRLGEDARRAIKLIHGPVQSLATIVALAGLAFALTMIWTVVRLTRWPLANGVLALGVIVLILALPRLVDSAATMPVLGDHVQGIVTGRWRAYVPGAAWSGLAIVLLVAGFFLPSFRRWQRETLPVGAGR